MLIAALQESIRFSARRPLDPDRFQGLSLFDKNATLPRESSHEDS